MDNNTTTPPPHVLEFFDMDRAARRTYLAQRRCRHAHSHWDGEPGVTLVCSDCGTDLTAAMIAARS